MKPITEADIDQFVRAPDSLTEPERARIEAHLDAHPEARLLATSMRELYEGFDALPDQPSGRLEIFLHTLQAPHHTIALSPLKARHEERPVANLPTVAMAAAAPAPMRPRTRSVAALASPDENLLVRILRDARRERYLLAVISTEERTRSHVVVTLPELGLDVATSAEGRAEFEAQSVDEPAWRKQYGLLRVPVAEFRMDAPEALPRHVLLPEHAVAFVEDASGTSITVTPRDAAAPEITLVACTTADGAVDLVHLDAGRGILPASIDCASATARFYG